MTQIRQLQASNKAVAPHSKPTRTPLDQGGLRHASPEEKEKAIPATRPSSAPDSPAKARKSSENTGSNQLEPAKPGSLQCAPESSFNPRKRRPGGDFAMSDSPSGDQIGGPLRRGSRHDQRASGANVENFEGREEAYTLKGTSSDNVERKFGYTGPKPVLYNPDTDNHNTRKDLPKEEHQFATYSDRQSMSPRISHLHSSMSKQRPNLVGRQITMEVGRSRLISNEPDDLGLERDRSRRSMSNQAIPGSEHFPDDDPSEDLDHEPEMLLQPETRPISHEQLVVEVKGKI